MLQRTCDFAVRRHSIPTFQFLHLGRFAKSTRLLSRRVSDRLQRVSVSQGAPANSVRGFLYSFTSSQLVTRLICTPRDLFDGDRVPISFLRALLVARMSAAFWMFAACLLLGLLAMRISGQPNIGIIVAGSALLTPWFFEIGRLVFTRI